MRPLSRRVMHWYVLSYEGLNCFNCEIAKKAMLTCPDPFTRLVQLDCIRIFATILNWAGASACVAYQHSGFLLQ